MRATLPLLVSLLAIAAPASAAASKGQAPRPPQAPALSCPVHGNACPCGCQDGGACDCGEAKPRLIHAPPGSYFRLPDGRLVTSYDPSQYQPAASSSSPTYQTGGGTRYAPALPYQPTFYPNVGFRAGGGSRGSCSGGG